MNDAPSNAPPMALDHVAIAVRSIAAAAERLCRLTGYRVATATVTNTRQKVNVQFLEKPGSLPIKLIEPSGDDSPLVKSLHKGEGLHHLCFRVADVAEACGELSAGGARLLAPPQPGEAFDDHEIAFLYLGLGLNVELIDTDARRGRQVSRE